ncbi:hypothetical protein P3T73_12870 [Kiritimatiellota bacterium B12222]|nr:hypothetical protein P3T73_12870 [Kiritimatiellota bacterium B12222]
MKSFRFLLLTSLFALPFITHAQPLLEQHDPVGQNVRVAWAIDSNGGVGNDSFNGIEVAYASKIFPLDQMLISYTHTWPQDASTDRVLIGIEEFYPLCEVFKLYGVAGVGYMWTDMDDGQGSDNATGWVGKIGGGFIYDLNKSFDLYAEMAYLASDRNLWMDGNDITSSNWEALLGFRFKY